jgi:hypothetical protein
MIEHNSLSKKLKKTCITNENVHETETMKPE